MYEVLLSSTDLRTCGILAQLKQRGKLKDTHARTHTHIYPLNQTPSLDHSSCNKIMPTQLTNGINVTQVPLAYGDLLAPSAPKFMSQKLYIN
jgi:hypothetical protein